MRLNVEQQVTIIIFLLPLAMFSWKNKTFKNVTEFVYTCVIRKQNILKRFIRGRP